MFAIGIEQGRANRIARTEITTALRRARWDEHDSASDDLGLNVMLLHLSALSPTTRQTHALRHGKLYTSEEVRDWYSINGNAINCKCSQVTVLVDEKGVPLNSSVIDIAKKEFTQTWGKRMATNKSHHCCDHKHAA